MRYILGFFNFWRNFLIGGDWVIAVTIAWSLDFLYQLSRGGVNPWYLLPVIGVVVIGFSVHKAAFPKQSFKKPKRYSLLAWQLWLPLVLVLALPTVIFHIKTNEITLSMLWVPASLYIIIATLVTLCLSWPYKRYPFGTSLVAILITRLLAASRIQYDVQNFAQKNQQSALINTLSIVIAVLIILWQISGTKWWNNLFNKLPSLS
jgi:hypothetical protein